MRRDADLHGKRADPKWKRADLRGRCADLRGRLADPERKAADLRGRRPDLAGTEKTCLPRETQVPNELKLSDRGWQGQTQPRKSACRQPLFAGARG